MMQQKLLFLITALVLLLSACATAPSPTPEPAQNDAPATYHPLDTRTQIEEIDAVLQAVASGDPKQMVVLFGYTRTACMSVVNALGGPPQCRAGEADGTTVEVLPVLSGEGTFIHADEADEFRGLQVIGIHSIFRNSPTAYVEENFPAGEFTILFIGEGNLTGVALRIDAGKIVRLDYLLEKSAIQTIVTRDALSFILEPR
jgi:hypothetical protein